MSKFVKPLVWVFGLIVVLLVALVLVAMTVDPNVVKPKLQAAASEQGYTLDLPGDIAWQFYPSLGLSLGEVAVTETKTGEQVLAFESAAIQVALLPLLKRELQIVGITISNANVTYRAAPEPAKDAAPSTTPADTSAADKLDIEQIKLENSAFTLIAASGEATALTDLNAHMKGINLRGERFTLELEGVLSPEGMPAMRLGVNGELGFNLAAQQLDITALSGSIDTASASGKPRLRWDTSGSLVLSPDMEGRLTVGLNGSSLRSLLGDMGIALPAMQGAKALSQLTIEGPVAFSPGAIEFTSQRFIFDETSGQLLAKIALPKAGSNAPPQVALTVNGDRLIVADYLPPADTSQPPEETVPSGPPVAIPFEVLRDKNIEFGFGIKALHYNEVKVSNLTSDLRIRNAKAQQQFSLQVAEGTVEGDFTVSERKPGGSIQGEVLFKTLKVDSLLEQLGQPPELAGPVTGSLTFSTRGATDLALKDNLSAELRAESAKLKLSSINIEQRVCEAVSLLQGGGLAANVTASTRTWAEYSELSPLAIKAKITGNKLVLENLDAKVQQLSAQSRGELDINTGEFRFPLDISMSDFSAGIEGCVEVDKVWRKRAIPLRCKGNIANIGAKTCLPDGPRITEYIKDEAKQAVKKEVDKAKSKAEDKIKEALEKNLDSEQVDSIKGALKGLFGR